MEIASTLSSWFIVVIIYSFVGWVYEVMIEIIFQHKVVNRGFLIGPICPIYGIGALILTLLLKDIENVFAIFVLAVLLCAIIEYITSYIMEKLFRVRWWDYSDEFGNIHGRICLKGLLCFGIMGVLVLKFVNPVLFNLLDQISPLAKIIAALVLLLLLIADIATSLWLIMKCRVTVGTVCADATDEITMRVREILLSKGKLNRRLAKAFPTMKVNNKKPHRKKMEGKPAAKN